MLMLQIAGGVVLGFLALALLPQLLKGAVVIFGLAVAALAAVYCANHYPDATGWVLAAGAIGVLGLWMRNKARDKERIEQERLTKLAEGDWSWRKKAPWLYSHRAPTPELVAARREIIKTITNDDPLAIAQIAADIERLPPPKPYIPRGGKQPESMDRHERYWLGRGRDPVTLQPLPKTESLLAS